MLTNSLKLAQHWKQNLEKIPQQVTSDKMTFEFTPNICQQVTIYNFLNLTKRRCFILQIEQVNSFH